MRREVPSWAGIAITVAVVLILGIVGYRIYKAGGPRSPGDYPPEAFKKPAYMQPGYANSAPGAPGNGRPQPAAGAH